MAKHDSPVRVEVIVNQATLQKAAELQRIGNRTVKRAQAENRRQNIPNWYSIGGVIVSDRQLTQSISAKEEG